MKVDLDIYSHYDNINHVVQNESNRWHSNYHFNPGKRIVHSIIREIITNIFYNLEATRLWSTTIDVLCDYHKTAKAMQTNLEHELKVKSRNECLKSYFKSNVHKDVSLYTSEWTDIHSLLHVVLFFFLFVLESC